LLPEHLVSDEKHTRINGKKAFVATTVAKECILGRIDYGSGTQELTRGYLPFKEEVCNLNPDYRQDR
jgi:hypothetical protein